MTIDNLFPHRIYKLRVQAWSLGGEGKYSSPEKEFRFGEFCLFFLILFDIFVFILDQEGRLLIRKFSYYSNKFSYLFSFILVYNPDTSLLYHNRAFKQYSSSFILFIFLCLNYLFQ
jgi:hypothetical protein